jgi:hypothetical protein
VTSSGDPVDRVRTLLLRGDNQLKHGRTDAALESFIAARSVEGLSPELSELVERRIESLRALLGTA